jgi:hypothetical protein
MVAKPRAELGALGGSPRCPPHDADCIAKIVPKQQTPHYYVYLQAPSSYFKQVTATGSDRGTDRLGAGDLSLDVFGG